MHPHLLPPCISKLPNWPKIVDSFLIERPEASSYYKHKKQGCSGTWVACLTERLLPSAVATCTLLTHVPLALSCPNILNLLPLPTVFSFYKSSDRVASVALLPSRVRLTHEWSRRLRADKRNTMFKLRKSVLQGHKPIPVTEIRPWHYTQPLVIHFTSISDVWSKTAFACCWTRNFPRVSPGCMRQFFARINGVIQTCFFCTAV